MKFEQYLIESQVTELKDKLKDSKDYLKAPNGKKSNLPENLWLMVRTDGFKKWFGDWEKNPESASKIIDKNGEPLVVYHGSGSTFEVFDKKKAHDKEGRKWGVGTGKDVFSFTDEIDIAYNWMNRSKERAKYSVGSDAPKVYSVFLNIRKPMSRDDFEAMLDKKFEGYTFRDSKQRDKFIAEIRREMKKQKYDGIVAGFGEYSAFESSQIKSVDNKGSFNSKSANINEEKDVK